MPAHRKHFTCTVEGCDRPHKAQGYCASHHLQHIRGLPIKPLQERVYDWGPVCSIEGCDNPERSKGLCGKHYVRWKRHGDTGFRYKPGAGQ